MFVLLFKILLLGSLIKILELTGKPFLCSGIYTFVTFILSLVFGAGILGALIMAAISFALASLYFWLLDRFSGGVLFWVIAIGGLVIGIV